MTISRTQFIGLAAQQIGVPYVFGGTSLKGTAHPGLDCSGLPYAVCKEFGLVIPRTSQEQFAGLQDISAADAIVGDLVFYDVPADGPPQPQHEGIVWSSGQILQAPHTGDVVKLSPLLLGYPIMGYRRIPFAAEPLPEPPVIPSTTTKDEAMSIAISPDGTKTIERVNPQDHLLVFTLPPGATAWQVTDVTAQIAAANPSSPIFTVQP